MIYVVLGMHKSGTTLISQILHHSGIHMGEFDETRSYDEGNQYEREDTRAINHAILRSHGKYSLDIARPKNLLRASDPLRQEMHRIISTNEARSRDWGFKDPRTCFTYPLWAQELPPHKLVIVYRQIEELWKRYRSHRNFAANPYRAWRLVRRWSENNLAILDHLKSSHAPHVVINYTALMNDQREFDRLQTFVGRTLSDCRRPELNRGIAQRYPMLEIAQRIAAVGLPMSPGDISTQLSTYTKSPAMNPIACSSAL